jgi:hypothetical protein
VASARVVDRLVACFFLAFMVDRNGANSDSLIKVNASFTPSNVPIPAIVQLHVTEVSSSRAVKVAGRLCRRADKIPRRLITRADRIPLHLNKRAGRISERLNRRADSITDRADRVPQCLNRHAGKVAGRLIQACG